MDTIVLDGVLFWSRESCRLGAAGAYVHAAEGFARAAEEASSLGADSLVVLDMQLKQGSVLGVHAITARQTADPCTLAAHRATRVELYSVVVAALARRRAAHTLLEGECHPLEEAWHEMDNRGSAGSGFIDKKLVGYALFLNTATALSMALHCAAMYAAECSPAQLHAFAHHAVSAADMLLQSRAARGVAARGVGIVAVEADFVEIFRKAVEDVYDNEVRERTVRLLQGALRRLLLGGVPQAQHTAEYVRELEGLMGAAAGGSRATALPGLHACALPGCGAREAHPEHFKCCGACRAVVYCCREHQAADWAEHRKHPACKAARRAAKAKREAAQLAPSST